MLMVSDSAINMLAQLLEDNDVEEGQGLRLSQNDSGQYGLNLDGARDGDQVVKSGERPVLFVQQEISAMLDGATLDVTDTDDGIRLALRSVEDGPA